MEKKVFTEVRCDYFDEEEQKWSIDAYADPNPDTEDCGKVVGWIDGMSGNVYYNDESAADDPLVKEVVAEKQSEIRKENKQRQGELGETIAMLTAIVWNKVYKKMREPDCTALSCAIRDAAYKFEEEWNAKPLEEKDGYYIDCVDEYADRLIVKLKDLYC